MMPITQAASQNKAFPLAGTLNRLSLSESHTKHRNSPSLPVRRNLLIKLNCAEIELANSLILAQTCRAGSRVNKGEKYSGSVKPENYSGSAVIQHGCIYENQQVKSKEKGGTENTALWGYGFYHHELNQHLAARQDLQLVRNYSQNPYMLNDSSNLRNDNANLRNYKNQHIAEQYARTCESFVGHRVTVSKPVQPSGASLAFLRWRRLISPFTAVTMNCAFVSPLSRLPSISATISCGNLAFSCCDFLLIEPVAITESPCDRCDSVYAKKTIKKDLKCDSPDSSVCYIGAIHLSNAKPGSVSPLTGPLTTNVNASNEAAMLNHTPTRFKFLFLAVHRSDLNAKPHRESVTAHSEQDARRSLAGQFVLSFAGRLPEVTHG
ncbi:Ash protein family [Yersinia kristensenii]|nr:Ash protein family [Yersinia kristensenii]